MIKIGSKKNKFDLVKKQRAKDTPDKISHLYDLVCQLLTQKVMKIIVTRGSRAAFPIKTNLKSIPGASITGRQKAKA